MALINKMLSSSSIWEHTTVFGLNGVVLQGFILVPQSIQCGPAPMRRTREQDHAMHAHACLNFVCLLMNEKVELQKGAKKNNISQCIYFNFWKGLVTDSFACLYLSII